MAKLTERFIKNKINYHLLPTWISCLLFGRNVWKNYAMQITISITVLENQDKKLLIMVNDLLNNLSNHWDLVKTVVSTSQQENTWRGLMPGMWRGYLHTSPHMSWHIGYLLIYLSRIPLMKFWCMACGGYAYPPVHITCPHRFSLVKTVVN